ncbi:PQQ-binding-like beta-propeller repeat protein [Actinoplanes sp. TBRC 11911]|uniref:outer membrane protein assembly factor BamB family protein n=1 Tax=Actinoplanes sp. TBRC 11911 TaxID=2729386 RepID=UPI00145D54E6|nr:PQQ-binding-like beta-propeller repeat protein [Actinoplanes sp. TBRC 11911]NMO52897.1 PQQ-binding-like beta-propeller repeat protein [Actinoplanes sp. TBRC 11911]
MYEVLWSRSLHMRSDAVAVAPGSVVVAERHSRLVRLDAASGQPRWEVRVEDCWGTLEVAGDRCLYLSQAGVLHCVGLDSGRLLWATPGLRLRNHVAVSGSVVFTGGWRGYHPLTRVSLDDGVPLSWDSTMFAAAGPLARPRPVRSELGGDAVLIAGADEAVLWLVGSAGTILAEWTLPEPVAFDDVGDAFDVADDGRVAFVCGRRTVAVLEPGGGVRVLWQHERDVVRHPPMLRGDTLWLVDGQGVAVVDLTRGVVGEFPGVVRAAASVPGEALFAGKDGRLVGVDPAGFARQLATRPALIGRLLAGSDGLVHAVGKGHLTTFSPTTP